MRKSRPTPHFLPSVTFFSGTLSSGVLFAARAAHASGTSGSDETLIRFLLLMPLLIPSAVMILSSLIMLVRDYDAQTRGVARKNAQRLAVACALLALFGFIVAAMMHLLSGFCVALALLLLLVAYLDFNLAQRLIRDDLR